MNREMIQHPSGMMCPSWQSGYTAGCAGRFANLGSAETSSKANIDIGFSAPWVIEAARKLERLSKLQAGWDSYGGQPLTQEARQLAVKVIREICQEPLPIPGVVLGSDGTVQLEWRRFGKELELDLADKKKIEYVKCSPGGEIEDGMTELDKSDMLADLVKWFLQS